MVGPSRAGITEQAIEFADADIYALLVRRGEGRGVLPGTGPPKKKMGVNICARKLNSLFGFPRGAGPDHGP